MRNYFDCRVWSLIASGDRSENYSLLRGASLLHDSIGLEDIGRYACNAASSDKGLIKISEEGGRTLNGSSVEAVLTAIESGATLKIEGLEHRHDIVGGLAAHIAAATEGQVLAKAFITPMNKEGFLPHFDSDDVLVVQLFGAKTWSIYSCVEKFPFHGSARTLTETEKACKATEFELKCGDVLYIPGGVGHSACCGNSHSVHLSIGIRRQSIYSMLNRILSQSAPTAMSLRTQIHSADSNLYGSTILALKELGEKLTPELLMESLKAEADTEFARAGVKGLGTIGGALLVDELIDQSTIVRNSGVAVLVRHAAESLRIYVSGSATPAGNESAVPYLALPHFTRDDVDLIVNLSDPIRIKDLPGQLDLESKVLLCKALARLGVIRALHD